jgi:hypothetical protein
MTDKEIQLIILRHLEAGNTSADVDILTDVSVEQRKHKFIDALIALKNQGFLCPNHADSDEPKLWNAYVSADGRAFMRENTPEPLPQIIGRQSLRLLDIVVITILTTVIGTIVALCLAWYFKG